MKRLWNENWMFLKTQVDTQISELEGKWQDFCAVDMPHDWLIYDALNLYEDSTGWYLKKFHLDVETDKKYFIYFEGIYMDSTIYINGEVVGEWKYGYSSFSLDITSYLRNGENEVLVRVLFKGPNSRWYSGAGIYRDVWFLTVCNTYLPLHATYVSTKKQGEDYELRLETEILGEQISQAQVEYELLDSSGNQVEMSLMSKEGAVSHYMIHNPQEWDIIHPTLYTLRTKLFVNQTLLQQEQDRFGFRHIELTTQEGFFLNGRHVKLNGVCEHHDLGALGAVFNKAAAKRKLTILKEMGANAIRGTHNMMAPGLMDLADEMGFLFVSEAFDMWEKRKTEYDYARFFPQWWHKDVESWVKRDRNHPCVIMWSIGNEIYDTHVDERGQEITRFLKAAVEQYDSCKNAYVTIGSNFMPWENAQKCADIVKVAGYNYSERYYEEHHKKYPDWMIYGSETSSIVQSRGIYHFPLKSGILSDDDEQCSALGNSTTSWGAKSIEECITYDRDTKYSMGQFIWTGFDYIGEPTPYHTKNSYFGQVDTAGFPKDSYYVWQSAWTNYQEKPMIHVFPYWDFNEKQLIDIRVCSNAPEVELFLNGRSLGKQSLQHEVGSGKRIMADYQIPYEKGALLACAYDEKGNEIAREEKKSFGNSHSLVITPENTQIQADGRDLLFLQIGTLDVDGNPVENATDRVMVEVEGAGRLIGLDNGDSTDYDQYKGKSRRLFSGKLLAIVQANQEPGDIKITVTGRDLQPATVICQSVYKADIDQTCITTLQENSDTPINLGNQQEIPVRRIVLKTEDGNCFTPDKKVLEVVATLEPPTATDRELEFEAVNEKGVVSNLVTLAIKDNKVTMTALGDGDFYLRCKSKSGTDKVRIISQLEFSITGLGQAYLNPYEFISGSSYTSFMGEVGNGNERGVATARDGETVVTYAGIDFGPTGSDELTIPIFALDGGAYPIQFWEGVPGEEGSVLLADVVYQKPSIWNVYQEDTYRLSKRLKGITAISIVVRQKVHIKGFTFTKYEKAWLKHNAVDADAIYGDHFNKKQLTVEEIGNNVSLIFENMDFKDKNLSSLTVKGRALKGSNTIHVRFHNGQEEIKQIVEFAQSKDWAEQSFCLEPLSGAWDVSFVFMPGSCFDFEWFYFQ